MQELMNARASSHRDRFVKKNQDVHGVHSWDWRHKLDAGWNLKARSQAELRMVARRRRSTARRHRRRISGSCGGAGADVFGHTATKHKIPQRSTQLRRRQISGTVARGDIGHVRLDPRVLSRTNPDASHPHTSHKVVRLDVMCHTCRVWV